MAIASIILMMSTGAFASVRPDVTSRSHSNGVVYLFRGGFNVFSTGVDVLAKQLRARGIDATAYGNADWPAVTEKATTRYTAAHQPIILVGHSFGANAAVLLAAQLDKARIPVALIVLYDTVSSMKVTGNVRRVVDFVSSDGRTMGVTVTGEPDFAGHIDRIEARQGHFTVDKDPRNHDISIAAILRVVK
jgi:pimeloyl-ACP methyl ester carboxylesterase